MKTVLATAWMLGISLFAIGQNVVQIEYFLDTDVGFGKNKVVSVTPAADGPFSFTVDASAASAGYHILYMRIRDSNGQWSHTTMRNVEVVKNQAVSSVVSVEYFFDTDPGIGKAAFVALATPQPDGTFNFVIPKEKTTSGAHTLYVRAKDSPDRNWSLTQLKAVTIVNCTPPDLPTAVASQTVCAGNTITYTAPAVALATGYQWTVPTGWTITSGQGTNTVVMRAPAVTSVTTFTTLSVAALNSCDAGPVRLFSATVNALPTRPAITVRGDTVLVSSATSGNQWFLNGTSVSGATGQSYRPVAAGQYTVQVTQNGCVSPPSEVYNRIVTALYEPRSGPDFSVTASPNPGSGPVTVELMGQRGKPMLVLLTVRDLMGRSLYQKQIRLNGQQTEHLDLSQQPAGLYLLNASTENQRTNLRLVRE